MCCENLVQQSCVTIFCFSNWFCNLQSWDTECGSNFHREAFCSIREWFNLRNNSFCCLSLFMFLYCGKDSTTSLKIQSHHKMREWNVWLQSGTGGLLSLPDNLLLRRDVPTQQDVLRSMLEHGKFKILSG